MSVKFDHLIGFPFIWGTHDCFSLVRAFYWDNFEIKIRNYARPSDWSSDVFDMMEILPEREGFTKITSWKLKDLRPGDVLAMAIGERNANHFSIYAGDGQLIHHLYGRRSNAEEFRDAFRNQICFILRHPDVPDLRPVYPDVDIASLLSARNAPPTP